MKPLRDVARAASIAQRAIRRRKAVSEWSRYEATRPPLAKEHYQAVAYFADGLINLYQLEQWYEPLRRLSETHPVAIIARSVTTAVHIKDSSPLPVFTLPYIADVEAWMANQPVGAVFYVNQNTRNFQMMRFRQPAHVFLSHGESEKDYMASNQLKAYDYTFIAGDAARDRLRGKLIGYDVDARTVEVGRPQVDVHHAPPHQLPSDDRTVVLYAPTWEGDRPSMTYSSVQSHAPAMVAALLATGHHRVVYRPHPRTGIADSSYASAHKLVVDLIQKANASDPGAHHVVDIDSAFGWHLDAADACIADISAVALDWLPTGKPIVLTEPANLAAQGDPGGIASILVSVTTENAHDIASLLEHANNPDRLAKRVALVNRYFGDVTPGASMDRWLHAAKATIASRLATE